MAQFYGTEMTYKESLQPIEISWKQGSFLGIGGDRSARYNAYVYTLKDSGASMLVFVQDHLRLSKAVKIDGRYLNI